jgi:hypothetical protein
MRHRLFIAAAVGVFLYPLVQRPITGQAQPTPAATPPAQSGQGTQTPQSPDGRGGDAGGGRGGRGGGGTGGNAGLGGVGAPGRGRGPAGPAPRNADGRAVLTTTFAKEKGVWLPGQGGAQVLVAEPDKLPFQPWARALFADRTANQLEPHTRCKPSGFARQFLTPYGVEIVELPELARIYIFDIGGPHTYRTIYMDRRTHPTNLAPSFYGDSIGWWEGDTLVVDTVAYNEGFWIDRRGLPTTDRLHTIERFTRTDSRTVRYDVTVDDPGAYTATWQAGFTFGLESGTELFEYVCQQANYADNLMLGELNSVDRTSAIVP